MRVHQQSPHSTTSRSHCILSSGSWDPFDALDLDEQSPYPVPIAMVIFHDAQDATAVVFPSVFKIGFGGFIDVFHFVVDQRMILKCR